MTFLWRDGDRSRAARVYLNMRLRAAAAIVCPLAVAAVTAQPASLPDPRPLPDQKAFLQEVRKHLETDDERQSGYMYVQTQRDQKLDKSGRPTSETLKVFESYPGLPDEPRWERVISEDGKPVPIKVRVLPRLPPTEGMTAGGIYPAIVGTVVLVLLMSIAGVPAGVITALYLSEYAGQKSLIARLILENSPRAARRCFGHRSVHEVERVPPRRGLDGIDGGQWPGVACHAVGDCHADATRAEVETEHDVIGHR